MAASGAGEVFSSDGFIKGFISGQLVVFLLLWFLVRMVFLRNAEEADAEMKRRIRDKAATKRKTPHLGTEEASRYLTNTLILNKIYADVENHVEESCDWLNVLIAQGIEKYRRNAHFLDSIVGWVDKGLNGVTRPSWLGPILITELSLGEDFPVIKSARIRPSHNSANVRAELSLELRDHITVGIDTHLIVNWPRPGFATLPVSLALSVVRFSGTLAVELVNNGFDAGEGSFLSFSVLEDYDTEFDVRSLLGHRTKIKDLPKLTDLLISRFRSMFEEKLVEPSCFKWGVPEFFAPAENAAGEQPVPGTVRRKSSASSERRLSLTERGRGLHRLEALDVSQDRGLGVG
ncbi:hypothetical protein DFJ74DRAFT_152928 [Hyaloraphidium curvatum]|nr:hypothetical protein DFJ74DRAFT_152928 [Hyaloraphidium curvatum]